jgi:hypothetical protein
MPGMPDLPQNAALSIEHLVLNPRRVLTASLVS